jgi:two-component system, response regulator PdtaR
MVEPGAADRRCRDRFSKWAKGMTSKVLIVEDEILVALNLQQAIDAIGYETVGVAPDSETAFEMAEARPDIAFVDINLRDGETGPEIGARLARDYGACVLFVTANPAQVANGIAGTVGFLNKPFDEDTIASTLDFLARHRAGITPTPPPHVRLFNS